MTKMKYLWVLLSLCLQPCLAESVYQHTILVDSGVLFEASITPEMRDEYTKKISKLLQPPTVDLGRKKNTPVPDSLQRFYKYKKLLLRMSVDSPEGLRVRTRGDLKAEKICTIPHTFPVVITALGEMTSIDGIQSAWVEILLPRYAWKGDVPEFGWVFGGYLKELEDNSPFYFNSKDYYIDYYEIPYTSGHLYDIDERGKTFVDKFLERFSRDSDQEEESEEWWRVRYRRDRETFPDVLKMVQSGVHFKYDFVGLFKSYWEQVRIMRQVYPCSLEKDSSGSVHDFDYDQDGKQDSVTVVYNNNKLQLKVHTNNSQNDTQLTIQEADYHDFKTSTNNELEIIPCSYIVKEVPVFLVQVSNRIRDTKLMHHWEYSFYIIKNDSLIKFCTMKTPSDYLSSNYVGFYFSESDNILKISMTETTALYGMEHDDTIGLQLVESFPYILINKDDLQNFEIVRLGPSYSDESE